MTAQTKTAPSTELALSEASEGGSLVIAPKTMGELVQFSELMAASQFVPNHLRRKPGDCLAVAMQAIRWNMDPFSVAQKTYFVREGAAPGYEAQLIAAVVNARAPIEGRLHVEWSGTGEALTCTVTGRFKNDPQPKARTVSIKNITTKNSPLWKSDPQQQLAYYTIRAWARLFCPEVIMGVYAPDEVETIAPRGPTAATDVTPKPTVDRLKERLAPQAPAETVIDAEPVAQAPAEPEVIDAEIVSDDPPAQPNWRAVLVTFAGDRVPYTDPRAFLEAYHAELMTIVEGEEFSSADAKTVREGNRQTVAALAEDHPDLMAKIADAAAAVKAKFGKREAA